MSTIEFWIQLENHHWDISPRNIDRMTGRNLQQITGQAAVTVTLISPETGVVRNPTMFRPLRRDGNLEDALILRRYTPNWAAPDDHKVNPWDLNEPDPTDNGTMGTIPGPVIECEVGDTVVVHFRNKDFRERKAVSLPIQSRTHSLHPHGFVFSNISDGAYPLSPPDPNQPVGPEAALWSSLGVTNFKKGDRVPPGATFTYTWNAFWPTNAGVWLYHDHSICDTVNVQQGAIGIIVIHNPNDPEDVRQPDLPGGSFIGSPVEVRCFPPGDPNLKIPTLPHDANAFGMAAHIPYDLQMMHMSEIDKGMMENRKKQNTDKKHKETSETPLNVKRGDLSLDIDLHTQVVNRLCLPFYRQPPSKAQYLLLFHELGDGGMCINGRKYLGNTPTLISGVNIGQDPAKNTKMRFGIVGMGNTDGFHTFHLHGHRWIIPGPDGNDPNTIQNSIQSTAVSQFEDTRVFGPANSFNFTINQGSFMGSRFTPDPSKASGLGEWHLHCHVLTHMMDGMMGSLLVIQGGELALGLPTGEECPEMQQMGGMGAQVQIKNNFYDPANIPITKGQTVTWTNTGSAHTVTSNPGTFGCSPSSTEPFASPVLSSGQSFNHTFNTSGTYAYHCEVHGCTMAGTVTVT